MPRESIKRTVVCSVDGCEQVCPPRAKVCSEHYGLRATILNKQYRKEGRCSSTNCCRWPEPGYKQCRYHIEYMRSRNHEQKHLQRKRQTATLLARKIRLEVIDAYGGKCCICAESDPIVLEIDHINGLNSVDPLWPRGGVVLHRAIRRAGYPKDLFQVLCANCHRRKTFAKIIREYEELR